MRKVILLLGLVVFSPLSLAEEKVGSSSSDPRIDDYGDGNIYIVANSTDHQVFVYTNWFKYRKGLEWLYDTPQSFFEYMEEVWLKKSLAPSECVYIYSRYCDRYSYDEEDDNYKGCKNWEF